MFPYSLDIIRPFMCDFMYMSFFALLHWETLKNSSMFNDDVRMFFEV